MENIGVERMKAATMPAARRRYRGWIYVSMFRAKEIVRTLVVCVDWAGACPALAGDEADDVRFVLSVVKTFGTNERVF